MINAEDLRNLCIKNNWFTHGNNEQYEKLFALARPASKYSKNIDNVALIIFFCSDMGNVYDMEAIADIRKKLISICC